MSECNFTNVYEFLFCNEFSWHHISKKDTISMLFIEWFKWRCSTQLKQHHSIDVMINSSWKPSILMILLINVADPLLLHPRSSTTTTMVSRFALKPQATLPAATLLCHHRPTHCMQNHTKSTMIDASDALSPHQTQTKGTSSLLSFPSFGIRLSCNDRTEEPSSSSI